MSGHYSSLLVVLYFSYCVCGEWVKQEIEKNMIQVFWRIPAGVKPSEPVAVVVLVELCAFALQSWWRRPSREIDPINQSWWVESAAFIRHGWQGGGAWGESCLSSCTFLFLHPQVLRLKPAALSMCRQQLELRGQESWGRPTSFYWEESLHLHSGCVSIKGLHPISLHLNKVCQVWKAAPEWIPWKLTNGVHQWWISRRGSGV